MNLAVVLAVQSLTSAAFAHRVRYFVAIIMYLSWECHASGVMGPMKSIAHLSKIYSV